MGKIQKENNFKAWITKLISDKISLKRKALLDIEMVIT